MFCTCNSKSNCNCDCNCGMQKVSKISKKSWLPPCIKSKIRQKVIILTKNLSPRILIVNGQGTIGNSFSLIWEQYLAFPLHISIILNPFNNTNQNIFICMNKSVNIRHMHRIKPKGLSLGLGFQFVEYLGWGLGLGFFQIFCKFLIR